MSVGDTLILTDKGLVKMDDLINEKIDANNKDRTIDDNQSTLLGSLSEYIDDKDDIYRDNIKNIKNVITLSSKIKDGYMSYNISDKYDIGNSDVIIIRTNIGIEMAGIAEHGIVIINKDGNLAFKKLGCITKEDYIAISYNTNIFNDMLRLNFVQSRSYDRYDVQQLKNIGYMNEDIARLLGYVISEGNCCLNNDEHMSMTITNYDGEMIDDIHKICKNLDINCGNYYDENEEKVIGVRIPSINFTEFMYYLGYRHLSQNKEVPWSILQADKNSQIAFLRGLFDGDGTVGEKGSGKYIVGYDSSSYELCRQLQIMLINMGIIGRLSEKKGTTLKYRGELRTYEKSYGLSIYGGNIIKFGEIIGFGLTRKQDILNEIITKLENTERWTDITIPFIENKLRILYDKLILLGKMRCLKIIDKDDTGKEKIRYVAAKYYLKYHHCRLYEYTRAIKSVDEKWKRQPSNLTLKKFLGILSPVKNSDLYKDDKIVHNTFSYLDSISDLFIFDKVEEINKGRKKVYATTIDSVHSYIGNGLINHDMNIVKN